MASRAPPTLRDDRLHLQTLGAMAHEFDALSRADGRTWPATDFVQWLADEWRASTVDERERRDAA